MRAGECTAISPATSVATGWPASSRMRTDTPGTGGPHEPGRGGSPRGSMVTTPASVEPKHSSTSWTPKRSFTRSRIGALPRPSTTRR